MIVTFSVLLCLGDVSARAQQGSYNPPPSLPQNQHQGGGATLEVPTTGGQSGATAAIPPPVMAPQMGQELSVAPHELRSQNGYEQATITVTSQQGGYVTGLQKDDFKLYVDGIQRPIEFFRHDLNAPVSIGILVDTSGSMSSKLPQARAAIAEFIRQLNDRDDVFLFAFADRPFLLQPFTTNHRLVLRQLGILQATGDTALFDTVIAGLLMVQHGRWDKKALLVVTDGMDNESQAELPQVVAYARRTGVLVYSIGIGDANSTSRFSDDQVDVLTLRTLSSETGARTFLLKEVGDGFAMRQDCETISEELRQQYTVGFVAPEAGRGGYRNLRVDAPRHPEDTIRLRKGVTVGGGTESTSADSIGGR